MITNLKKFAVIGVVMASGLALMGTVAFAQGTHAPSLNINGSGQAVLAGTVTAVSGSALSVSSWGGTWTINTSSTTGIDVGDKVKVHGNVSSGMTITANKVVDLSAPVQRKLSGTISNFNASAGTFTLSLGDKNVAVTTTASTQVSVNGSISTVANLTNGMTATVSGSYNATTNTMAAASITVPALQLNDIDGDNDGKVEKKEWRNWLKDHFSGWFKRFAKR